MKTFAAFVISSLILVSRLWAEEYDTMLKSYGELQHIAGLGQLQDTNGWQASMEGADPLAVELSNTHMTMADAHGNLYLADKESHSILKITPDRTTHTVVGTHVPGNGGDARQLGTNVALGNPNGVFVLTNGTVYILDRDNDKIRKLDPDGYVSTVVTNALGLGAGRGLWVAPDANLLYYTASTTVRKWTPTGGVSNYATGFVLLGNIDVDPRDGNLVVTDSGAHRIYRVFPDGSRTVIAGDGTTAFHGDGEPATDAGLDTVRGIAFLPHGGYFLATQGDGDIWYVDTNNVAHVFINGAGSSTPLPFDRIAEPRGISIAPWGDLFITESDYGVVRVVPRKLAVSDVRPEGDAGFRLSWYSMPSASYDVEFAQDLLSTNWDLLTSVTGATAEIATVCTVTNVAGKPQGFYRVRRTP